MGKNLVTVKGIVDPQALCKRIQKKTMRKATIISPVLPPPPPEGEAQPLVVLSQVQFLSFSLSLPFLKRKITSAMNIMSTLTYLTDIFLILIEKILHMYESMYEQICTINVPDFFCTVYSIRYTYVRHNN
jgi:hypothetical protein